jgi:hypothetical protein
MCSLFDVILDRPMPDASKNCHSRREGGGCAGAANPLRNLLDCVIAYDRADWNAMPATGRRREAACGLVAAGVRRSAALGE